MSEPRGGEIAAYIGLGSNLETPAEQIHNACDALNRVPCTRLATCSSLYRNPPLGPPDQPDYINAVARLATTLAPIALLDELQAIERAQGRVRTQEHWGPRTIDLDLLLYGDRAMSCPRLVIPHPQLHRRSFVVHPLLEIAPALEVPGLGPLVAFGEALPSDSLMRISVD